MAPPHSSFFGLSESSFFLPLDQGCNTLNQNAGFSDSSITQVTLTVPLPFAPPRSEDAPSNFINFSGYLGCYSRSPRSGLGLGIRLIKHIIKVFLIGPQSSGSHRLSSLHCLLPPQALVGVKGLTEEKFP